MQYVLLINQEVHVHRVLYQLFATRQYPPLRFSCVSLVYRAYNPRSYLKLTHEFPGRNTRRHFVTFKVNSCKNRCALLNRITRWKYRNKTRATQCAVSLHRLNLAAKHSRPLSSSLLILKRFKSYSLRLIRLNRPFRPIGDPSSLQRPLTPSPNVYPVFAEQTTTLDRYCRERRARIYIGSSRSRSRFESCVWIQLRGTREGIGVWSRSDSIG